jgi:light-regulated signal transduction histidine kinase (bacteriophytochrome)
MDASSRSKLNTRIRQQEVVAELGQQALEEDDLDQLMHDGAVAVSETLDNDYCRVLELLPGGDEPPQVHISAEQDADEWMTLVSDTGIGVVPEDRERVFEVFQSLHTSDEHTGTGIGLALCERIVERHDGNIWVDSEPGDGSTFSFTLPAEGSQ